MLQLEQLAVTNQSAPANISVVLLRHAEKFTDTNQARHHQSVNISKHPNTVLRNQYAILHLYCFIYFLDI